jgi:hypothetical protein
MALGSAPAPGRTIRRPRQMLSPLPGHRSTPAMMLLNLPLPSNLERLVGLRASSN